MMERVCSALQDRVQSAEQAATLIKSGMTLGMSGFTLVGYPKAIPQALVRLGQVKDMILKESLEEKRAETARAVRVFGSDGEAPSEV